MDIVGDLGKLMDQEIPVNSNQYDDYMANQLLQMESLLSRADYSSLTIEQSCKIYWEYAKYWCFIEDDLITKTWYQRQIKAKLFNCCHDLVVKLGINLEDPKWQENLLLFPDDKSLSSPKKPEAFSFRDMHIQESAIKCHEMQKKTGGLKLENYWAMVFHTAYGSKEVVELKLPPKKVC